MERNGLSRKSVIRTAYIGLVVIVVCACISYSGVETVGNQRLKRLRENYIIPHDPPRQAQKQPDSESIGSIARYQAEIGEPADLLEDNNIQFWTPRRYIPHARLVFSRLQRGHYELQRLFAGYDMPVKFSIEHYPTGHKRFVGGTPTQAGIWYGFENLQGRSPEFVQFGEPHVVGYLEEMAHCFKSEFGITGFEEAEGMLIGQEIARRISPNPHLEKVIRDGYQELAKTTDFYLRFNEGPPNLPPNIWRTRILAAALLNEVIRPFGWEGLTKAFALMRADNFPCLRSEREQRVGVFVEYVSKATGRNAHLAFAAYGLPLIVWALDQKDMSNGVMPNFGDPNTVFQFRVCIRDREGTPPKNVTLHLIRSVDKTDTKKHVPMKPVSGSSPYGFVYTVETALETGDYRYSFSAVDGKLGWPAVGEPVVGKNGLQVQPISSSQVKKEASRKQSGMD